MLVCCGLQLSTWVLPIPLELLPMGENKRLLNPKVCQKRQHGPTMGTRLALLPTSLSAENAWPVPSREHPLPMGKAGFRAARAWAAQTELKTSQHSAPPCLAERAKERFSPALFNTRLRDLSSKAEYIKSTHVEMVLMLFKPLSLTVAKY